jgi:hypothetical protein
MVETRNEKTNVMKIENTETNKYLAIEPTGKIIWGDYNSATPFDSIALCALLCEKLIEETFSLNGNLAIVK